MRRALIDVHGSLELDGHPVEAAGRTDGAIARDLLLAAGLAGRRSTRAPTTSSPRRARSTTSSARRISRPAVRPASADVAPRLAARPEDFRFSLVTGNFERIARLKLARAGSATGSPRGRERSAPTPRTASCSRRSPARERETGRASARS
jgi:hypothetical protein